MDDPTIFGNWLIPVLIYIEDQLNAGRHPNSITEDEIQRFKKSLPPASSPSYFIMTINMNGPAIKGSPKIPHKRRMLLSIIIRCFSPAIIFCQELPGFFKKKVAKKCGYEYISTGKESAVLWRTKDIDGSTVGLKTTDRRMIQLRDEVCKVEGASEFLTRIAMVKLTSLKSADTVLAVSYHGQYKVGIEERHRDFKCLDTFLHKVIKEKGIDSYIIGGDFNFNTLHVEQSKDVAVPYYQLSPQQSRRKEASSKYIPHKDNFICYPTYDGTKSEGKIRVSWTRPFRRDNATASDLAKKDHEEVKQEMATGTVSPPNAMDMLDHDPIVGVIEFPRPTQPTVAAGKVVRSLSKDFKKITI